MRCLLAVVVLFTACAAPVQARCVDGACREGGARVKYSWYWPALGSVNGGGNCANGEPWQRWARRGVACPVEWPFGTRVIAFGSVWECVDRGSAVRYGRDGLTYVDFLVPQPHVAYGTVIRVQVLQAGMRSTDGCCGRQCASSARHLPPEG